MEATVSGFHSPFVQLKKKKKRIPETPKVLLKMANLSLYPVLSLCRKRQHCPHPAHSWKWKAGLVLMGKQDCGSPQSGNAVLMMKVCISTGFVKDVSGRGLRKGGCQWSELSASLVFSELLAPVGKEIKTFKKFLVMIYNVKGSQPGIYKN